MKRKAAAAALLAFAAVTANAQSRLGAYSGTFEVTGTERDPKVTYKATVKVTAPVTKREPGRIEAEFLAGEAPPATIKVTQYDYFYKEKSADSSGHFAETTCKLAAPVEIPAMVLGVVDVDTAKKNYSMSFALTGNKPISLDCTSTRGRPYKKSQGVALVLGTGAPGMQSATPQALSDPARLAAKFTMDAAAASGGAKGPIVQEWDLKLSQ